MTVMLSRCIGLANLDRRDLKRYADGGDASVPTASVSLSSLRTPLAMSACSRRRRKSLDGLLELPKLCVPKLK